MKQVPFTGGRGGGLHSLTQNQSTRRNNTEIGTRIYDVAMIKKIVKTTKMVPFGALQELCIVFTVRGAPENLA